MKWRRCSMSPTSSASRSPRSIMRVEAYKIADRLAERGVCAAMWADWWGFKMEAYDGIQENIAIVDRPTNSCAIVHSDSEDGIQRLNQEAAKAMARGVRAGFEIPPERAIRWLTSNPAKALGLDDRIGTLEAGKMADVVIWNRDPFSVYALADQVFIDGALAFDRAHPPAKPPSDFLLGPAGSRRTRDENFRLARRAIAFASTGVVCGSRRQDILIRDAKVHTVTAHGMLEQRRRAGPRGQDRRDQRDAESKAPPGATVVEANGRPLTPGLFGGCRKSASRKSRRGSSTVDATSRFQGARHGSSNGGPEFDVTLAYNPRSTLVPVTRIEGLTWTVLEPGRGDSIIAGQGSAVALDGRSDGDAACRAAARCSCIWAAMQTVIRRHARGAIHAARSGDSRSACAGRRR